MYSMKTIHFDVMQASYDVQNTEFAISQLAQTVIRSEVGKLMLDTVFRERANLNLAIVGSFLPFLHRLHFPFTMQKRN